MNNSPVENENTDFGTENFDVEDEDGLTLEIVIQLMEEAWLNEKFSPEILPHKSDIIDILLGQIAHMENALQTRDSKDFTKGIHQMEIDRLRFLVASYLRLRLGKIESYSTHILKEERARLEKGEDMYLCQNELDFAQEYEENIRQHFESIMSFCPSAYETRDQIVTPNIHSMVFLKSKKDIEGVMIDDGKGDNNDLIDLTNGSQILIGYQSVSNLVKNGDVHLI